MARVSNGMPAARISAFAGLGEEMQWCTACSRLTRRSRRARKVSAPAMREGVMTCRMRGARLDIMSLSREQLAGQAASAVKVRVECGVVVHFHLAVHFEQFASGEDVVQ